MTVVILQCLLLGIFAGQSAEICFEISHDSCVTDLVVCCMYIGASGCLLKKIVWVDIDSKWSAVVLAPIISWSEVSIRGINSPVAFEVGVQRVFSEFFADGSLENCLDFCKVDSSFVERLVPHPRD